MELSKDFKEFIELLNANNVKYLVVGGYAVGYHGHPRYTKDIDLWILMKRNNAENIIQEENLRANFYNSSKNRSEGAHNG